MRKSRVCVICGTRGNLHEVVAGSPSTTVGSKCDKIYLRMQSPSYPRLQNPSTTMSKGRPVDLIYLYMKVIVHLGYLRVSAIFTMSTNFIYSVKVAGDSVVAQLPVECTAS